MKTDKLTTATDFRTFFETIPEDRWTIGTYQNEEGQCCAQGLLGRRRGNMLFPYSNADNFFNLIGRFNNCSPMRINDGFHPNYQQPTPKQRILALCDDMIKEGF